jgi:hypothetical protein
MFVQQATEAQFDKYTDRIAEFVNPKDYIDYLPSYKLETTPKRLKDEVPSSKTVSDLETSINSNQTRQEVSNGGYLPGHTDLKPEYRPTGEFKKGLGKILNVAWCETGRKDELIELINKAESAHISIHYSKNKLYDRAFKFLGIPHVEDIMSTTEASYVIGKVTSYGGTGDLRESTKKETRLLNILHIIEGHYGLDDVFRIADVKEHLSVKHQGETIVDSLMKTSAAPIRERNKIYLDRASLNLGKVDIQTSKSAITKFDVLVVMLNIQTISSGLSRLIYNTIEQTVDHYTKTEKISKEIALLMTTL